MTLFLVIYSVLTSSTALKKQEYETPMFCCCVSLQEDIASSSLKVIRVMGKGSWQE